MSKLAAQLMLKQGSSKIINIGSLYSFTGGPNQLGYTASKGAVRQMTMAMSNEWAGRGINVNKRHGAGLHRHTAQRLDAGRSGMAS